MQSTVVESTAVSDEIQMPFDVPPDQSTDVQSGAVADVPSESVSSTAVSDNVQTPTDVPRDQPSDVRTESTASVSESDVDGVQTNNAESATSSGNASAEYSTTSNATDIMQSVSVVSTFSDVLNDTIDPSPGSRVARKKRKVAHAAIVTSSPYKASLLVDKAPTSKKKSKQQQDGVARRKQKKSSDECSSAAVVGKRKMRASSGGPETDNTPCMYCEIHYNESHVQWIKCWRCHLWACCDCARMDARKTRYICDTCK